MDKKLGKGILVILFANIVNLLFNLIANFILPKYLSVDSYSAIKTYQLYANYVGVFALGFSDGMYLKYGGKELNGIDGRELKIGLNTLRYFLIIESIALLVCAVIIDDKIVFAFVLSILSLNMSGYYKNLFQAVGEFTRYSRIMNMTTGLTFTVNLVLIFCLRTDNYFIYLLGYVVVYAFIWIRLEYEANALFSVETKSQLFSFPLFIDNVKSGIMLMVGNFSSILLTSMDRWFVKIIMDSLQFAQYSFAVSLEGFLNAAVTPVTVTMYNFFCRKNDEKTVISARKCVLVFASLIIALAFPAKFIVEIFLINYIGSLKVLFLLFGAQVFFIPNKAIYVNLYKAMGKQARYFIRLLMVLLCGAISNAVFVYFLNCKEAFAYATVLSAFIWIGLSCLDFCQYKIEIKEIIYILIQLFAFLMLGFHVNAIVGCLIYIFVTFLSTFTFFKSDLVHILASFRSSKEK